MPGPPGSLTFGTGLDANQEVTGPKDIFGPADQIAYSLALPTPFGVGTIGQQNAWTRFQQKLRGVFGLATGLGLDDHVLAAYRFLCTNYVKGDRIYLFGFSRGAYTVRALAGFIHVMGLFRPDQLNAENDG